VGLPDKVMPDLPPAAKPEPAPKAEEKKPEPPIAKVEKQKLPPKPIEPEAINLDKTKNKEKAALQKLKQMQALDEIQNEIENDKKKKAAEAAAKFKYKGNVLAPGTELTGVNKLQSDAYLGLVHQHMLENWALPEYLKNRSLRTDVVVKFDESGNILEKAIVKASGNASFDEFVLAAIQKSSPVPPPPAKFVRISSLQGFLFHFSHDN
jgi:TonB family protein